MTAQDDTGLREALPWLDDIIRSHSVGFARWLDAHRHEATGALTFVREDGPFYECMRSTLDRLRDYRAALANPAPKEQTDADGVIGRGMKVAANPAPAGLDGYCDFECDACLAEQHPKRTNLVPQLPPPDPELMGNR